MLYNKKVSEGYFGKIFKTKDNNILYTMKLELKDIKSFYF